MGIFSAILYPIEWLVAIVWVAWLKLFSMLGMSETSGWTWALAIAGVVVVVRAALIPLFVKQIKSSRRMQIIQPEIAKIQKKYKGRTDRASREEMTREQMELYKKTGTNPFSSCLPILVQMPIFFALFRVLNGLRGFADGGHEPVSMFGFTPLTRELAQKAEASSLFGVKLSDTFMMPGATMNTMVVTLALIVFMAGTQFVTAWQMYRQNMPKTALEGPMAQTNKIMMYAMPVIFAVTGVNFPLGTLVYWFFTNVWTMAQQFIIIHNMPTPGSPAYERMKAKKAARGKEHRELTLDGLMGGSGSTAAGAEGDEPVSPVKVTTQRQQPVSKKRAKKKR